MKDPVFVPVEDDSRLVLYHFTSARSLPKILTDGRLLPDPDDEHIVFLRERNWPSGPVLWLTSDSTPNRSHGLDDERMHCRFTVEVDAGQVERWLDSDLRRQLGEARARQLEQAGGSDSWYITARPILRSSWLAVETIKPILGRPAVRRAVRESGVSVSVRVRWDDAAQADVDERLRAVAEGTLTLGPGGWRRVQGGGDS